MAAKLEPSNNWTLTVDSDDLRLILTALRGGITPEQQEAALTLQARLAEQRAAALKNLTVSAEQYVTQIKTRPAAFGEIIRPTSERKAGAS